MRLGRLIDNVGVLLLRQLTTWGLTLVLIRFLPRLLGAEGLGKITFAESLMALLLVPTNLGTGTYIAKRISLSREAWSALFWNTCALRLTLGLAVLAVSGPVILLLHLNPTLRDVLYLTGVTLLVVALGRAAEATIQGLERMRWLSLAEIANKATTVGLGIWLLWAGYGVVTFAGVILLGFVVGLAVQIVALISAGLQPPRVDRDVVRDVVIGSMPFLLATAVLQLYMWSDVSALALLTRDAVVGWYGAALQIYATLNFLPLILMTALLPPLSQLHAAGNREGLFSLARSSLTLIFLVSLPMAVGLALLSDRAIHALGYPADFHHSVPVLRILAANLPLTGLLIMLSTIATATDRQVQWVKIMAAALTLNLVLDVALILLTQRWLGNGGIGAAAAFFSAEAFQLTLALRVMPARLLDRRLLGQVARSVGATAVMAAVVLEGCALRLETTPIVLGGALVYVSLLLISGALRPRDLTTLLREWSAARRPRPEALAAVPALLAGDSR